MNTPPRPTGALRAGSVVLRSRAGRAPAGLLPLLLCVASVACGATSTWVGNGYQGAEGTYWSDAANWNPHATPPNGNAIVIGASFGSGRKLLVTGAHSYAKLSFNSGAGGVHLSHGFGDPKLTLTSGSLDCFAANVTLSTPLHMTSLGTWHVSGTLKVTGQVTGGLVRIFQSGFVDTWHKTGSGTLELAGNSTYKGALQVKAGTVLVSSHTGLSPGRPLWVDREGYTNPEVEIAAYLDPVIGQLVVRDGTVTGHAGSSLTITSAILGETAEVNVALGGNANIAVEDDAIAALRKASTFAGTITLGAASALHVESDACLGASGNTVVVAAGGARLVSDGWQEDLAANRTLQIEAGRQLTLEAFDKIAADLVGAGTVELLGDTSAELTAANPNFSGLIVRDGGDLTADGNGSLGYAWGIILYDGDFVLDASNPAYGTPNLSLDAGTTLVANNTTEQFGELQFNSGGQVTLQLDQATPGAFGVLTFQNINLPTTALATPRLLVTNWVGMPNHSGLNDRIICETLLTPGQLQNIEFVGINNADGAIQLAGGEIVPALD